MKIAVISAIFGDMEKEKPFATQSVDCDRFCFTPFNSPFPIPNLPPRLQAKYFKLQPHKVLPDYDFYIWIDGNIEVTNPDFVWQMIQNMQTVGRNIKIQRHHERETLGQEIDFILNSENPYLLARYGNQPLHEELNYYKSVKTDVKNAALYSCNIFCIRNTTQSALSMDKWFDLVLQWSFFDQSAFSFLADIGAFAPVVTDFGPMLNNGYFILHPHDNWKQ